MDLDSTFSLWQPFLDLSLVYFVDLLLPHFLSHTCLPPQTHAFSPSNDAHYTSFSIQLISSDEERTELHLQL